MRKSEVRVKEVTEEAIVVESSGASGKRETRWSFPLAERAKASDESSDTARD